MNSEHINLYISLELCLWNKLFEVELLSQKFTPLFEIYFYIYNEVWIKFYIFPKRYPSLLYMPAQ